MSDTQNELLPVILAGGSGTRLWPLSRKHYAKQYLAFGGEQTMLQETVQRLRSGPPTSITDLQRGHTVFGRRTNAPDRTY